MSRLATLQGVDTKRRLVRLLLARVAVYTFAFAVAVAASRVLVGDQLSDFIADMTSTWVEVPDESVELYRLLGYQEGSLSNGHVTFRDLSDYRAVVGIIKGPVVWGAYAVGLIAVAGTVCAGAARQVDEITGAIEQLAEGGEAPMLSADLAPAQRELTHLAEHERQQVRAAQAAESRKNELVAYLAHDIKTPLTSIVGYLALLAENPDLTSEQRVRFARNALDKARSLDGMMDEFFEITRYNLSAIPIEREFIDTRLFVEQVADELFVQARDRNVELVVDAPEGIEAFIDPKKMARALSNIIRNGIAFAREGSEVLCEVTRDGDGIVFTVTDAGKEIAPAHLERIFERFYREESARSVGGAGLGLAIAREIVEAHGGTVCAQSAGGVTTFTIRVPAEDQPAIRSPEGARGPHGILGAPAIANGYTEER